MSRYEPDTGAWVYDGPTDGVCSECGTPALLGEDGVCPRCLAGEPVLTSSFDACPICHGDPPPAEVFVCSCGGTGRALAAGPVAHGGAG